MAAHHFYPPPPPPPPPPYFSADPQLARGGYPEQYYYPRPMLPPRAYRRRFRAFLGQVLGVLIIGLSTATLFLGQPDKYFPNVQIPPEVEMPEFISGISEKMKAQTFAPAAPESSAAPASVMPPVAPSVTPFEPLDSSKVEKDFSPSAVPELVPHLPAKIKGAFVVQIVASPTIQGVKDFYNQAKGRHSDLFRKISPGIQPVKQGRQVSFYRLYVYPFNSKRAAQNFCYQLKARGEDCFVKRR